MAASQALSEMPCRGLASSSVAGWPCALPSSLSSLNVRFSFVTRGLKNLSVASGPLPAPLQHQPLSLSFGYCIVVHLSHVEERALLIKNICILRQSM